MISSSQSLSFQGISLSLPRSVYEFAWIMMVAIGIPANVFSQNVSAPANPVDNSASVIRGLSVVRDASGSSIEIISTRPVKPSVQALDSPPRIVIDLPNAISAIKARQIQVLQGNILTMRIEPYRSVDPRLKIVVTLLVPHGYSTDSQGNRLLVHLKPPVDPYKATHEASPQKPSEQMQVASAAPAEMPAIVPVTSGVGNVVLAGRRFAAGSAITAGSETATLQLSRGGEIQVCPGTSLSVTPSKNAKDLMLGLSTGAMEAHYGLQNSSDTVLTPDFRIVFSGPGRFDYAISTDSKGNTCVRGLRGNSGAATVSELIGDRSYQVKPSEQAMFHSGRIDKVDTDVPLECGCPPPVPILKADAASARVVQDSDAANVTLAPGPLTQSAGATSGEATSEKFTSEAEANKGGVAGRQTLSNGPEIQPLAHEDAGATHVQVEAPLVFESKSMLASRSNPIIAAETLPVLEPASIMTLETKALPPVPDAPVHRGLMARVRGFFAAIFR